VLHQTLAVRPETAQRVRGDGPVRSSCRAECGSTIDQPAGHEPKVAGVGFWIMSFIRIEKIGKRKTGTETACKILAITE